MNSNGLKFNLFGIPTEIKTSFLFLAVLLYSWVQDFGGAAELTIWAGIAVLLHELGHAWAYQRFGLTPRIELYMLGGLTFGEGKIEKPLTNGQQIIVSLAGPFMSVVMGAVLWGIIQATGGLPHYFLEAREAEIFPLFFSFGWGILNLIPILPLDGGRVLHHTLAFNPRWNAELIAVVIGLILGGCIIIYTLSTGQIWNSMLVGFIVFSNFQRLQSIRDEGHQPKMENISKLVNNGNWNEALDEIKTLIPELKSARHQKWTYQMAAYIFQTKGDMEGARVFMAEFPESESHAPELKLALLQNDGDGTAAIEYAKKSFALKPTKELGISWVDLLIQTGQYDEVHDVLKLVKSHPFAKEITQHAAMYLFEKNAFMESIQISKQRFEAYKLGQDAYNVACGYARLEEKELAIDWLKKSVGAGYTEWDHMRNDNDLQSLVGLPAFKELLNQE